MVLCMTAGTAVIMWLGENITDRGIGNGMSILMFTSIAARIPSEGQTILQNGGGFSFTLIIVLGLAIIAAVVLVEQAQRRIPVQYAKRMIGRRQYGGTSTYLPLKVNQAGVIPVIFASSLLYIPQLIAQLQGNTNNAFQRFVSTYLLDQSNWVHILDLLRADHLLHVLLRRHHVQPRGARRRHEEVRRLHPGHPAGPSDRRVPAVRALADHPAGSLYLGVVAILPNFFFTFTGGNNQNFPFGGTAVLIMVGVGLDTMKQIESQLMQRNYEGFLR